MADAERVVAMWGLSDIGDFGEQLHPRIARLELGRRLPRVQVRTYAPLGWDHPTPMDGGELAEPLGRHTPARLDELAASADAIVIGGGDLVCTRDPRLAGRYGITAPEARALKASRFFIDGLGRARERSRPVMWHAVAVPDDLDAADAKRVAAAIADRPYVSVRDHTSRRRLEAAGVEREIAVVPDPTFVLPRLVPAAVLEKRLAYLKVMGGFPRQGGAVVVQGDRNLIDAAGAIAAALRELLAERAGLTVVLLEIGADGDVEFADALTGHLGAPVARMVGNVGVEDIAATIAAAEVFVGSSFAGNVAAAAYGRAHVIVDLEATAPSADLAELLQRPEALVGEARRLGDALRFALEKPPRSDVVVRLQAAVDDHFDRLASVVADAPTVTTPAAARSSAAELDAIRRAHAQLARRVVAERVAMADRVVDLEEHLGAVNASVQALESQAVWLVDRLAATEQAVAWHAERRAAADAELKAIKETKTFRWTSQARAYWSRWNTRRR
jgi:polysaccharide pyruvyl transferase WcaK-like protein